MPAQASAPVLASIPSEKLTIGAGVAIFHVATTRVVVCYHSRDHYWFLPKGRKNVNEDVRHAAEREGYEESGYRNRLLPLPIKHRQTQPDDGPQPFVTEAIWTQLLPVTATAQYMLFWFAAETVPQEIEGTYQGQGRLYKPPSGFPDGLTLKHRIALDQRSSADGSASVYEPVKHEGTGVDEEEVLYESYLLPVEEARRKLKGSVMAEVIKRAWENIQLRIEIESHTTNYPWTVDMEA